MKFDFVDSLLMLLEDMEVDIDDFSNDFFDEHFLVVIDFEINWKISINNILRNKDEIIFEFLVETIFHWDNKHRNSTNN